MGTSDDALDFDLKVEFRDHLKINIKIFNRNLYFSLHVLVAYLESFPKHYN